MGKHGGKPNNTHQSHSMGWESQANPVMSLDPYSGSKISSSSSSSVIRHSTTSYTTTCSRAGTWALTLPCLPPFEGRQASSSARSHPPCW